MQGCTRRDIIGYYDEFWVGRERICKEWGCGRVDIDRIGSAKEADGIGVRSRVREVELAGGKGSRGGYRAVGELRESREECGFASVGGAEKEKIYRWWRVASRFGGVGCRVVGSTRIGWHGLR